MGGKRNSLELLEQTMCDASQDYGIDWGIECEVVEGSFWSMQVRITVRPNAGNCPDVSQVLYLTGLEGPEHGALKLLPTVKSFIAGLKVGGEGNGK